MKFKHSQFRNDRMVVRVLPDKYVMEAINLIDDLIKRNFFIIYKDYKIYFKDDVKSYKSCMKVCSRYSFAHSFLMIIVLDIGF